LRFEPSGLPPLKKVLSIMHWMEDNLEIHLEEIHIIDPPKRPPFNPHV
jgi:hypothetical protein